MKSMNDRLDDIRQRVLSSRRGTARTQQITSDTFSQTVVKADGTSVIHRSEIRVADGERVTMRLVLVTENYDGNGGVKVEEEQVAVVSGESWDEAITLLEGNVR